MSDISDEDLRRVNANADDVREHTLMDGSFGAEEGDKRACNDGQREVILRYAHRESWKEVTIQPYYGEDDGSIARLEQRTNGSEEK